MVDDPKEIARRRIAEARGEDPDSGAAEDPDAGADEGTAASANTEAAPAVDTHAQPAADDEGDAETRRDSAPGSTV